MKNVSTSPLFKKMMRSAFSAPPPCADIENPVHVESMIHRLEDLWVDYSKNTIGPKEMSLLNQLALESKLEEAREALFKGDYINETENRPVLHPVLRAKKDKNILQSLQKMRSFCDQVLSGQRTGYSNKPFTNIVNIGIGGSNLGPQMVVSALHYFRGHLNIHFISSVDAHEMDRLLQKIPPQTTLFIVVSKSFTTLETLLNAKWAKNWLTDKRTGENWKQHVVAVTADASKAVEFGIDKENIFEFHQGVGGRFSICSPVGLSAALAVGLDHFQQFLDGAFKMDEHFQTAKVQQNIPIQKALLSFWYASVLGYETHGIFPYDQRLVQLIPYLSQMFMESGGKSVDREGNKVSYQTSPIIWGGVGTDIQHSFFQLLHQGTQRVPCDFIVVAKPEHSNHDHHRWLLANCLGQTKALMTGNLDDSPFKKCSGRRPSTTIILKQISPSNLGMLSALYEHQVFCLGHLQNIYSFDQWGVEIGKTLAKKIYEAQETSCQFDLSTDRQVQILKDFL